MQLKMIDGIPFRKCKSVAYDMIMSDMQAGHGPFFFVFYGRNGEIIRA